MQEGQSPLNADRGQNLFTTSTHTGHHWRPGYYYPSSNFKVNKNQNPTLRIMFLNELSNYTF
jgi:hypothetical protein